MTKIPNNKHDLFERLVVASVGAAVAETVRFNKEESCCRELPGRRSAFDAGTVAGTAVEIALATLSAIDAAKEDPTFFYRSFGMEANPA